MTTNTEQNVTPEVPAWLNLDMLVPPELQDEIRDVADKTLAQILTLGLLAHDLRDVIERYDELEFPPEEGMIEVVGEISCAIQLVEIAHVIAAMFGLRDSFIPDGPGLEHARARVLKWAMDPTTRYSMRAGQAALTEEVQS